MNDPHPQEKTVAVGWVRAIVAAAERGGAQPNVLLAQAGLNSLPADPLARIALDGVVRLWRAAVALTGDPCFGLHMGEAVEPGSFNVVAYTLLSSGSLREAVGQMQQFQRLISDGARLQLVEQNGFAWLVYHPVEATLPFSPQQVEAVLACAVRLGKWIVGADFQPQRVCLTHAQIGPLAEYRRVLNGEPEFQAPFNAIGLASDLLDKPLPARNPELCQLHESLARRQLSSLATAISWKQRVATVLPHLLAQGTLQKEHVATMLGVTPRVLQNRLADEGSSYLAQLDEVRHRLALEYIADPLLTLGQIAVLLNFSDASAFYRAFRRWTGKVPGEYRQEMQKSS
jgi:AraC-like DNA-binding protein